VSTMVEIDRDAEFAAALVDVDAALARLSAAADAVVAPTSCEKALAAVERQSRRLASIRLRVLAAAQRSQAAQGAGFASTDAWVARRTRTPRSTAARQVALATELAEGHDATATALDAGLVSTGHAAVIVGAARELPETLSPADRRAVEETLVADAQRLDPDQLRRRARRVLETVESDQQVIDAHENELVRSEEEAAREKCALTLHDNGDGTTSGHFTVPTLAAAVLRKVLESMTAPRRMRLTGSQLGSAQEPVTFDWRKRRGIAFAELLEHLPTDHLHPKTAATVVVSIDETVLRDALKVAGLDTGETISAGEARRLACGAGIIPAVLGGKSVALDLGRESRLFSESQRVAAGLHHDTCAADGCERPYAWCELHHRQPWARDGRTDLRNAVPLCHWHHQRIHDQHYLHTYLPDGSIRFRRRP
jgi:hypothetical protein